MTRQLEMFPAARNRSLEWLKGHTDEITGFDLVEVPGLAVWWSRKNQPWCDAIKRRLRARRLRNGGK